MFEEVHVAEDENGRELLILKMNVSGDKSIHSLANCFRRIRQYSSCLYERTTCYIEGAQQLCVDSPGYSDS